MRERVCALRVHNRRARQCTTFPTFLAAVQMHACVCVCVCARIFYDQTLTYRPNMYRINSSNIERARGSKSGIYTHGDGPSRFQFNVRNGRLRLRVNKFFSIMRAPLRGTFSFMAPAWVCRGGANRYANKSAGT